MSKLSNLIFAGFIMFLIASCAQPTAEHNLNISLINSTDNSLVDHTVLIDLDEETMTWLEAENSVYAIVDGDILPAELLKTKKQLCIQVDIAAGDTLHAEIKTSEVDSIQVQKKTLAELWYKQGGEFVEGVYTGGEFQSSKSLRVPDECTDHSLYIKYEGPGWESDKVAYRLYLDWRNAVDIFGKKTDSIVLPGVGQDGYESYHHMDEWGMDVLKVGSSLGLGSIGFWDGEKAIRVEDTDSIYCEILTNGNLYSELQIDYSGWKIDGKSVNLQSSLSILAGSNATKQSLKLSEGIQNLCTGIVKSKECELLKSAKEKGWNYIATWGKQSLAEDNLGMAVIYKTEDLISITEDENSHVVVLNPKGNGVEYYFLAAWEQEPSGITSIEEFLNYLDLLLVELDHPVKAELN